MHFRGNNFWAVILGGSSGFGLATAKLLAAQGMNLCIVHRDRRQRLADIEAEFAVLRGYEIELLSFNQDALKEENRQGILENLQAKMLPNNGGVRLLLHAVAKGNLKRMVPEKEEQEVLLQNQDFALTIQAMALSLYDWAKALWASNMFATDARILGLTSAGNRKAWPYYAAVSAAKSTLEALVRSMALEFAPYGIRTNVIQAGITDTPSLRMIPGHENLMEYAEKHNPFRRLTKPEDVAQVVYLLTRDEAAWINGALIPVDGGEKLV